MRFGVGDGIDEPVIGFLSLPSQIISFDIIPLFGWFSKISKIFSGRGFIVSALQQRVQCV
jgi:hypothetical protein